MDYRRVALALGTGVACLVLVPIVAIAAVGGQSASACEPGGLTSSLFGAAATATSADPQWSDFLAAVREQETGSPQGDYTHDSFGCQGAYCWKDAVTFKQMATEAGVDVSAYSSAADAPASVQDSVASGYLWPIYQSAGGGEGGYLAAAAAWNGGTTTSVANPALGPGGTNYTYAGQVVAKMSSLAGGSNPGRLTSSSVAECSTVPAVAGSYQNPLRGVIGLSPERIDQGVDYGGSGPIYALGPGVVLNVYNAGWPDRVFIVYELTAGPEAGNGVYVAENLTPEVQLGEQVTTNTVLATLQPQFPNLETGWADVRTLGQSQAMTDHQADAIGDAGGTSTACGQSFDQLLVSLGAPSGTIQAGSAMSTAC